MSEQCFFACQAFELDHWPIAQAVVITSEAIGDIRYFLICLPDGSLGIRVERNGNFEDYETDIINPEGAFKVVVVINYRPLAPAIRVNGIDLMIAPVGVRAKRMIRLPHQEPSSEWQSEVLSPEVPEHVSDAEALFIRTVCELSTAAVSHDWYVLLKTSAPLRLLLLDGLLHKANQRYGVKLQFRVSQDNEPPPIEVNRHWSSIAPHGRPQENTALMGLDDFLKLKVFRSPSGELTVRDVIRAVANADGGVHFGNPRTTEEKLLLEMDRESMRMGQTVSRQFLKEICYVCVETFAPLVKSLQTDRPSAIQ